MRGGYAELLLILGLLCTGTTICLGLDMRNISEGRCIEEERQALLKFKQGLQDHDELLSSWGSHEEDCCKWEGIKCSNPKGHVVKLDLRRKHFFREIPRTLSGNINYSMLGRIKHLSGEISSSILGLQHLTYLDLSCNNFSNLPESIGSLTKLQYLNLSYNSISGTIPPQFGNLSGLISLDLSSNYYGLFEDHNLDWLFHLSSLRYLDMSSVNLVKVVNWLDKVNVLPSLLHLRLSGCDLSTTGISGSIPQQLRNLSSLISLDLSSNFYNLGLIHEDHNLDWFIHLSSLKHLDMSYANLSNVVNWLDKVNMLPSLLDLRLSYCQLSKPVPHLLANANTSSPLSFLDLSWNQLNSSIFPWLLKYTNSLVHLDLGYNELEGLIPKDLGNMVTLVDVDLSSNNLEGRIPQTLENLHNLQVLDLSNNSISGEVLDLTKFPLLRELDLSNNRLNGSLTKGMGKLSKLQVLDVSSNSLEGDIAETHLSNLFNLKKLDLSFNSLSILKFSPNWVPPFQLDLIGLSSCKLGPAFPKWLQTQKNYSKLYMFDVRISDTIPNWFWDISSNINSLNLSRNQIKGTIPLQWFSSRFIGPHKIDLSYNNFSGPLPQFNSELFVLDLSKNMFQGYITSICETNGSVNANYMHLGYLDLSDNLLSGEIPNCWGNMMSLAMLNLANNNLSGRIPDSICSSTRYQLQTLHLHNNRFIGELPNSLMNCSSLQLLDLGNNRLSGRIPTWIGTNLPHLMVLHLPSNLFMGHIPLQLCHLTSLQILDLSHNNIMETIPECLNNLIVMTQTQSSYVSIAHQYHCFYETLGFGFLANYIDNLLVNFKEKNLEYSKTLGLVKLINLSGNKLKGEIPREITSLLGLIGLNLSRNLLVGIIPQNIGDLERLESLDLSRNHLSGIIPSSLATLSLLNHLSLSNNNLSGSIPTGTQLQSFNASAYASNRDLCGLPLLKRCLADEAAQGLQTDSKQGEGNIQKHANSHKHLWFYTSIAFGFIVGFWGVCGSLLLKSSWRHAYFQYLDKIGDKFYVMIAINVAKFMRNFKTWCYQENI